MLHFAYFQSDVHRDEYKLMLDKHLNEFKHGNYRKNREDIYTILRSKLKVAIMNAKQLEKNQNNKIPSRNSPGTKVYEIFETLSVYLSL